MSLFLNLLLASCAPKVCPPCPCETTTTNPERKAATPSQTTVKITNIGTWSGSCEVLALIQKPDGNWDRFYKDNDAPFVAGNTRHLGPKESDTIPIPLGWPIWQGNTETVCFALVCQGGGAEPGSFHSDQCYGGLSNGQHVIQCEYQPETQWAKCDGTELKIYYPK